MEVINVLPELPLCHRVMFPLSFLMSY